MKTMYTLAQNKACTAQFYAEGKKLTVNLLGRGLGVASTFAGDLTGGAVLGLASTTLAEVWAGNYKTYLPEWEV